MLILPILFYLILVNSIYKKNTRLYLVILEIILIRALTGKLVLANTKTTILNLALYK